MVCISEFRDTCRQQTVDGPPRPSSGGWILGPWKEEGGCISGLEDTTPIGPEPGEVQVSMLRGWSHGFGFMSCCSWPAGEMGTKVPERLRGCLLPAVLVQIISLSSRLLMASVRASTARSYRPASFGLLRAPLCSACPSPCPRPPSGGCNLQPSGQTLLVKWAAFTDSIGG
jgi:hypothetical protein